MVYLNSNLTLACMSLVNIARATYVAPKLGKLHYLVTLTYIVGTVWFKK